MTYDDPVKQLAQSQIKIFTFFFKNIFFFLRKQNCVLTSSLRIENTGRTLNYKDYFLSNQFGFFQECYILCSESVYVGGGGGGRERDRE